MKTILQHAKRRGEWVEMQFMARAAAHGLTVSKPWGDSARYDFAVEYNGRFYRVQVKSTSYKSGRFYVCGWCPPGGQRPYTAQDIDLLAAYIIPEDIWYILPVSVVASHKRGIALAPDRPDNRHFPFMEAWHLFTVAPQ